jgi:hypothetical protein
MRVLKVPISEEQLAELEGEGDVAFFAPIDRDGEQKVLHIHIRHRKFYDVLGAAAVGANRGRGMNPPVVEGARLERE